MGQIFQSFIGGKQIGADERDERTRRNALDFAGQAYSAGDDAAAENALMRAGLYQEAAQNSALAEARRSRATRQSISQAMTGAGADATPQARAEAGAQAAMESGDTDQWAQFTQYANTLGAQERQVQGERAQWLGSAAASLLNVPVEQRAERARALLAASPYANDQHIAQMIDDTPELSDEALTSAAQNSMSAADILAGRERQERYGVEDQRWRQQFGLQQAQFGLQREAAERQAAMQEQMFGSEAVDYAARQYRRTGRMPSLGAGQTAAAMRQQIMARAAQLAQAEGSSAEADIITQRALQANTQALGRISTQRALIHNFEQTALRNLDLAVTASERVPRTGSPAINAMLNEARRTGVGDVETQNMVVAIETFAEEYAKVMSGAIGAAAATDSAREQAHRMINANMTIEQIRGVSQQMRAEMANRIASLDAEQRSLTDAMSVPWSAAAATDETHGGTAAPAAGAPSPAPSATPAGRGPAVGAVVNGYRFKGGNPNDRNSWERVATVGEQSRAMSGGVLR